MASSVLLPGSVPRVEYASLSLLLNAPGGNSAAAASMAEESVMSEPLLVVSPLLTVSLDTTRSSLLELHQHLSFCAAASAAKRKEIRRLSSSTAGEEVAKNGQRNSLLHHEDDEDEDDLLGSEHDLTMEQAPTRPHHQSRRETRKVMAQERRAAARRQFYQSESSTATTTPTGRLVGGGLPESGIFRPSIGGGGSLRLHYVVISNAEAVRNCASLLVGSGQKQKRSSTTNSKTGTTPTAASSSSSHHGSNAIAKSSVHSGRSASSRKSTSSNTSKSRGSRTLGLPSTSLRGSHRSSTSSTHSTTNNNGDNHHLNNHSNHNKFVVTSLDDASTVSSLSSRRGGSSLEGAVRAAVLCVGVVGTSWTVYGSGGPLLLSLMSHRLRDCATVLSHVRPRPHPHKDDDDHDDDDHADDDDDDKDAEAALEFGHSLLNALLMDEEEHRTNAEVGIPTDEDKDGASAADRDDDVVSLSFSTPRTTVSSKLSKKFTFGTASDFRPGRRRSTLLKRRFGVGGSGHFAGGALPPTAGAGGSAATTTTTASALMLLSSAQLSRMVSDQLHILAVQETDMILGRYQARERLLTTHNIPLGKASALRAAARRTGRRTAAHTNNSNNTSNNTNNNNNNNNTNNTSNNHKSSLLDASVMGCDLAGFDFVPPPSTTAGTHLAGGGGGGLAAMAAASLGIAAASLEKGGSGTLSATTSPTTHSKDALPQNTFDRLSPIEPAKKRIIPALRKSEKDTKVVGQNRGGGGGTASSSSSAVDGVFAKNTPFLLEDPDNHSVSVRNGRRNGNSSSSSSSARASTPTATTFDPFSSTGGGLDGGEAHPYDDSFLSSGDFGTSNGRGTLAGAKAAQAARAAAAQAAASAASSMRSFDLAAAFAPMPGSDPFVHHRTPQPSSSQRRPPPPSSSDSLSVISGITGASGLTDAVSLTRVRRLPVNAPSPETTLDDDDDHHPDEDDDEEAAAVNAAASAARRAASAAQAAVERSTLKRGVSSPLRPPGLVLDPPSLERPVSSALPPPHLVVHIALNEDLSCSYKSSKLSSCSIEGVVQIQVKTDSPVYVPFTLFLRDASRHLKTIQENRKYADDVSHEVQLFEDGRPNGDNKKKKNAGDARDRKFIVTVPKADSYFPVMRYKCSSELRPVPIRVQTRVRLHGKYCRVALQISSNPANEEDLTDLTIIMAVPSQIKGETLTTSPAGGVWNQSKGSVLWCVAELGGGEKFQLQAQFEMETPADKLPPDAPKPSFPVLVRCQCMYAQLSDLEFEVQDIPEVFPANVSMKLARRFRLSHREKA